MFKKCSFLFVFFLFVGEVLAFNLPPYGKLCGELKDLSGWKAEKCNGLNATNPMGEMASATRTYTRDNLKLEVNLVLGTAAMAMATPMAFQQSLEINSPEEYLKVSNIDGFKVSIHYDKKGHSGAVAVFLSDPPKNMNPESMSRMAMLIVNFQNMDWKEALSWAKKFDWKAIKASLK